MKILFPVAVLASWVLFIFGVSFAVNNHDYVPTTSAIVCLCGAISSAIVAAVLLIIRRLKSEKTEPLWFRVSAALHYASWGAFIGYILTTSLRGHPL